MVLFCIFFFSQALVHKSQVPKLLRVLKKKGATGEREKESGGIRLFIQPIHQLSNCIQWMN